MNGVPVVLASYLFRLLLKLYQFRDPRWLFVKEMSYWAAIKKVMVAVLESNDVFQAICC